MGQLTDRSCAMSGQIIRHSSMIVASPEAVLHSLPLERDGGRLHMIQMLIYENNTAPDTVDPKAHQPNYIVGARWGAITYDTSVDT
jgi:hypothetical protein